LVVFILLLILLIVWELVTSFALLPSMLSVPLLVLLEEESLKGVEFVAFLIAFAFEVGLQIVLLSELPPTILADILA
jgi:hypothetical protein